MILKQKQLAQVMGVTPETVRRYEREGLIKRVPGRPGAWYNTANIHENFLSGDLHLTQNKKEDDQ